MASVHRDSRGRSPYWYAAYTTSDGVRRLKSTKSKDKKQAIEIARTWAKTANLARNGKLTVEGARQIISEGVSSVFAASGDEMPSATSKDWSDRWLVAKEIETVPGTYARYEGVLREFLKDLGSRAERDISGVRPIDIAAFRDKKAKQLSRTSGNICLKVLRVWLGAAVKQGLITSNPASLVDILKVRRESRRRPFTLEEVKHLFQVAKDTEFEGLILFGLYTGQRLGDLARLTWRAVDLENRNMHLTTSKTGRRMVLPLTQPLLSYLGKLESSDDPNAPLFPTANEIAGERVGTLSNQFHELLVEAGLAKPRTHEAKKNGRSGPRQTSELSFHSLRHTATTFLKAAGVSDVLAREIIGHSSEAVSRNYTHLSTDDLRGAVEKLPDVTVVPGEL